MTRSRSRTSTTPCSSQPPATTAATTTPSRPTPRRTTCRTSSPSPRPTIRTTSRTSPTSAANRSTSAHPVSTSTRRGPGAATQFLSGTSMATPHVAGAAALAKAAFPSATAVGLKALLLDSVDANPALADETTTGGRLNVAKAVACNSSPQVWLDSPGPGFVVDVGAPIAFSAIATNCADSIGVSVTANANGTPRGTDAPRRWALHGDVHSDRARLGHLLGHGNRGRQLQHAQHHGQRDAGLPDQRRRLAGHGDDDVAWRERSAALRRDSRRANQPGAVRRDHVGGADLAAAAERQLDRGDLCRDVRRLPRYADTAGDRRVHDLRRPARECNGVDHAHPLRRAARRSGYGDTRWQRDADLHFHARPERPHLLRRRGRTADQRTDLRRDLLVRVRLRAQARRHDPGVEPHRRHGRHVRGHDDLARSGDVLDRRRPAGCDDRVGFGDALRRSARRGRTDHARRSGRHRLDNGPWAERAADLQRHRRPAHQPQDLQRELLLRDRGSCSGRTGRRSAAARSSEPAAASSTHARCRAPARMRSSSIRRT